MKRASKKSDTPKENPKQNGNNNKNKPKKQPFYGLKAKHLFFLIITVAVIVWGYSVYNAPQQDSLQAESSEEVNHREERDVNDVDQQKHGKDTDETENDSNEEELQSQIQEELGDDEIKEEKPGIQPADVEPDKKDEEEVHPPPEDNVLPDDPPVKEAPLGEGNMEIPAEHAHEEAPAEHAQEAPAEHVQEALAEHAHEEAPAEHIQKAPAEHAQEALAEHFQEAPAEHAHEEAPAEHAHEEAPADHAQEAPAEHAQEATAEHVQEAPAEHIQEAPAEHAQEAPAEHAQEAPAEHAQEAPAEHVQEAPTEHAQEAPAEHAKEAPAEHAQEAPAEHAQEAPAEHAQEAPAEQVQEAPAEHVQEAPAEHVQEAPAEHVQEAPAEHAQEAPAEHAQEAPAGHVQEAPAEHVQEAPAEHIQEAPAEHIQEAPVEQVQKPPAEKAQNEAPLDHAEKAPVKHVQEAPAEHAQEAPAEHAQEAPAEHVQEAPAEHAQEVPAENAQEVPAEHIQEAPVEHAQEAPVEQVQKPPAEKAQDEAPVAHVQEAPVEHAQEAPSVQVHEAPEEHVQEAPAEHAQKAPAGQVHEEAPAGEVHKGIQAAHAHGEAHDEVPYVHEAREAKFDPKQLKEILKEKAKPFFKLPQLPDTGMQISVNTSDHTDLFRDVPDTRNLACKLLAVGYNPSHLPSVSIIIPFHRESWSVLLRTINSVLFRTPPMLLQEIILVDDWCPLEEIKQPLSEYISAVPIIKLVKTESHLGVAKAKMFGARHATAEVMVFMDAQVEVNKQWLEPLLTELEKDAAVMVTPVIDYIYPESFEYEAATVLQSAGALDWRLSFVWKTFLDGSLGQRSPEAVLWTETALGAVAAVNREFFFRVGGFDEGMAHRDGDNVEIALRYWTCGNGVQVHPCSHAGHLFRHRLQYNVPSYVDTVHKNRQRIAEVFLLDYKNTFYQLNRYIPFTDAEESNLLDRIKFHDSLNCRSFEWYLENVAFDLSLPPKNVTLFGQLESRANKKCATGGSAGKMASMSDCSYRSRLQTISLLSNGHLLLNDLCLSTTAEPKVWQVHQEECKDNSTSWVFDEGAPTGLFPITDYRPYLPSGRLHVWNPYQNNRSELCLEIVVNPEDQSHVLGIQDCNSQSTFQYWQFTHKIEQSAQTKV